MVEEVNRTLALEALAFTLTVDEDIASLEPASLRMELARIYSVPPAQLALSMRAGSVSVVVSIGALNASQLTSYAAGVSAASPAFAAAAARERARRSWLSLRRAFARIIRTNSV